MKVDPAQPGPDEKDERVAEQTMKRWAQFAATGDPSVKGLVSWLAYTEKSGSYLDIGETLKVKQGIQQAYIAPPAAPASDVAAPPAPANPAP